VQRRAQHEAGPCEGVLSMRRSNGAACKHVQAGRDRLLQGNLSLQGKLLLKGHLLLQGQNVAPRAGPPVGWLRGGEVIKRIQPGQLGQAISQARLQAREGAWVCLNEGLWPSAATSRTQVHARSHIHAHTSTRSRTHTHTHTPAGHAQAQRDLASQAPSPPCLATALAPGHGTLPQLGAPPHLRARQVCVGHDDGDGKIEDLGRCQSAGDGAGLLAARVVLLPQADPLDKQLHGQVHAHNDHDCQGLRGCGVRHAHAVGCKSPYEPWAVMPLRRGWLGPPTGGVVKLQESGTDLLPPWRCSDRKSHP